MLDRLDFQHRTGSTTHTDLDAAILLQAVNGTSCGVVITDPSQDDNPIIFVNHAFEQLSGYSANEVLGRNPRFLQGSEPSSGTATMRRDLRQAIDDHVSCKATLRNYRKDGSVYWVELTVTPLRDETGQVTHYAGIQTDITALKQAEAQLRDVFDRTLVGAITALVDTLALTCPAAHAVTTRLSRLVGQTLEKWAVPVPWHLRCAAMLSHVGCVTVSNDLVAQHLQGLPLEPQQQTQIDQHPAHGAKLIAHIPHLHEVADGIAHQNDDFQSRGEQIPLIARILRIIIEYDRLAQDTGSSQDAITAMNSNHHSFDPQLFERFQNMASLIDDHIARVKWKKESLMISQLGPNMIVAEDLHDDDGVLLVSQGLQLTTTMRTRLRNLEKLGRISGAIPILVRTTIDIDS